MLLYLLRIFIEKINNSSRSVYMYIILYNLFVTCHAQKWKVCLNVITLSSYIINCHFVFFDVFLAAL